MRNAYRVALVVTAGLLACACAPRPTAEGTQGATEAVPAPLPQAEVQAQPPEQQAATPSPQEVALYHAVWDYESDGDGYEAVAKPRGLDRQVVVDTCTRVDAYQKALESRAAEALADLEFGTAKVVKVTPSELGHATAKLDIAVVSCNDSYPATARFMVEDIAKRLWPLGVDSLTATLTRDGCEQGRLGRATGKRADNSVTLTLD